MPVALGITADVLLMTLLPQCMSSFTGPVIVILITAWMKEIDVHSFDKA